MTQDRENNLFCVRCRTKLQFVLRAKWRASELIFYISEYGKRLGESFALSGEEEILMAKKLGLGISDM